MTNAAGGVMVSIIVSASRHGPDMYLTIQSLALFRPEA